MTSSSDYPAQYASDVVLRDGSTLHLRPIRADDAGRLEELYGRLSPESIYNRFFGFPHMDRTRLERLAVIDYLNEFALVGETGGRLSAVARFIRDPKAADRAEVAFTIADALQGRGIGTRLLERLAEIARERGIAWFDAYVLADNRRMMQVFLDSGFDVQRRLDGGVFHVTLSLRPTTRFEDLSAARAQHAAAASIRAFFEPGTVAVVGASARRGRIGAEIYRNLKVTGFTGRLVPVNPNSREVDGDPAFARVIDVPGDVDLAVVVVPADGVAAVIDDCIAKGVKALVVISAGFGETGAAGREAEAALVEKIRGAGIRMIGPNCMGILNTDPAVRLNATFSPVYPPEGGVAFSTQSGALGLAILDYATRLNIGISSFVSVGNKADVSGNDLIQYWADDPRTNVILLYLESFGNPKKFSEIARRVGRHKPIVAVKAGRSVAGARAASSHTGALAASDTIVEGLFRQAGVIRTTTLDELFNVAALLAHQPVPAGSRVAILTNAGGPGILAADACEADGLRIATLADDTIARLRAFLPAAASVSNPVDMLASAPAEHYQRSLDLLLADENVDSVIVIFIPPLVTEPSDVSRAIVDSARGSAKPVLATFMSAAGAPPALAPVPCYPFPEAAAGALARVTAYGVWRQRPAGVVPRFDDVKPDDVRAIVDGALLRGGGWLTPVEAQSLIEAAGVAVAKARVSDDEEGAVAAAQALGYPVVLKAVGPAILHKTEAGAVRLGIEDEATLRAACRDMRERLGRELTGFLVQQMVAGGVEMLVGALQDPTFGPLLLCGSGGTLVELVGDVVFRLHPLSDLDAAEMLREIRGAKLLGGYRGAPPADESALREALLRISQLLEVCPEIQEMDLNPLKVLADGVRAVDVRIRVDRRTTPRPTRRISY
jgi:acetyl coenzyme A synthetase (ADP forming)-like protein